MLVVLSLCRAGGVVATGKTCEARGSEMATFIRTPSRVLRGRTAARAGGAARCSLFRAFIGAGLCALLPPEVPAVTLPSPNGYDVLIKAGQAIVWTAIPGGDPDNANLSQSRAFLAANEEALASAHDALDLPSAVPTRFDASFGTNLTQIQTMRSLARAFDVKGARGRGIRTDGRHVGGLRRSAADESGNVSRRTDRG